MTTELDRFAHQPPGTALWAAELPRAAYGALKLLASQRSLSRVPAGDGRPVMLLPGLINTDRSNAILRRYLVRLGYDARGWGLGRNLGAKTIGQDGERLFEIIRALAWEAGEPVTLIGVSLGGMMARLAAHRAPEAVREVVTIASPYAGHPLSTNVWRTFELATGEKVNDVAVAERLAEMVAPLSVPSTAIWSASDGLVAGESCHSPDAHCIEVRSGHMGVQFRPEVLRTVADILGRGSADTPGKLAA